MSRWATFQAYLLARLSERSTWLGFTSLITAAGVALAPDLVNAIASSGAALAGLILVLAADQKKPA